MSISIFTNTGRKPATDGAETVERASISDRMPLLAAIVLVGLNLRPFITGIGPLASDIGAQTGLGLQGIADDRTALLVRV